MLRLSSLLQPLWLAGRVRAAVELSPTDLPITAGGIPQPRTCSLFSFHGYLLSAGCLLFTGAAIRKDLLALPLPMPRSPPGEHLPGISDLWGDWLHSCNDQPLPRQ